VENGYPKVAGGGAGERGISPRFNFDNIEVSFYTLMNFILNEEWHVTMYDYMRNMGDWVVVFWLFLIISCEILIVRLFIALFINKYIEVLKEKDII
jgi:hypothetical protein